MDEQLKQLIVKYLNIEEGITDPTEQRIEDSIEAGIEQFDSKEKLIEVLQQYVKER